MDADYWQDRWHRQEVGFDQTQPHKFLVELLPGLIPKPHTVFVPLCGRSIDMYWLVQQGMHVIGVELCESPIQDFFTRHQLTPQITQLVQHYRYSTPLITLYQGDILNLPPSLLSTVDLVYDRAALVALPEPLCQRYVSYLCQHLPTACKILLISSDFDDSHYQGPPFALKEQQITRWFGQNFSIQPLRQQSAQANPLLQAKGITKLVEQAHLLSKKV